VLVFTAIGFYGNFIQWFDVETVTAKILNAQEQVVLKGEGHIHLAIAYPVGKETLHGNVSVRGSDLEFAIRNGGLPVFYKRRNPGRVIPVAVLKDKQQTIWVTLVIGCTLIIVGLIKRKPNSPQSMDKMKEILKVMEEPPVRPLTADEELRIIKDSATGKYRNVIVKKTISIPPPVPVPVPYPVPQKVEFLAAERILVPHCGRSYELSIHYHRGEPEEDDIICSSVGNETYLVHPMVLFRQLLAAQNRFLSTLQKEELLDLSRRPCLVVECMDESREYHSIAIDGLSVSVPGKYLGLTFRLLVRDDELIMLTQGLLDNNVDEVPMVITTLDTEFVSMTSARYDADDEMWYDLNNQLVERNEDDGYVGERKDGKKHGQGTLTWA
jgi:hypothetical protein